MPENSTNRGYPLPVAGDDFGPQGNVNALGVAVDADVQGVVDSLSTVATTGAYGDLSGTPTLGTAAGQNVEAFATSAQGVKADAAAPAATLGNLLSANVATGTDTLGTTQGFVPGVGTTTLASSEATAWKGDRSLLVTATDAVVSVYAGTSSTSLAQTAVTPGETYTALAWVRSDATTKSVAMRLNWRQADQSTLASTISTQGSGVQVSPDWKLVQVTAVTPADAEWVNVQLVRDTDFTAGESFYTDGWSFHRGAGGSWKPPGVVIDDTPTRVKPTDASIVQLWNPSSSSWVDAAASSSVVFGTTAGTAAEGDDARITGAAQAADLATVATSGAWSDLIDAPVDGGDVQVSPAEKRIYWPGGYTVMYNRSDGGQIDNALQYSGSYLSDGSTLHSGVDDFAPVLVVDGGQTVWRGGNHGFYSWVQSGTSLTAGDVGAQWTNGSGEYLTLLNVADGAAVWSNRHNAAGTTQTSSTAPSGTWTSTSGKADVTFGTAPVLTQQRYADAVTDAGYNWTDIGRRGRVARTTVQAIPSWREVVAKTVALGRVVTPGDCDPMVTLTTTWAWFGDQPGNVFVDVSLQAHETLTISQWSGLQLAALTEVAVVGVTAGHALETWAASPGAVTVSQAQCAGGVPVSAMATRGANGGAAIGLLATGSDRSTTTYAARVNDSSKSYLIGYGSPQAALTAGDVVWCHGFRSTTLDTSDRQLHIVYDPATREGRWWLMAGSTGFATHPLLPHILGAQLVTSQGTATVGGVVTAAGVEVTGAGWAAGTWTSSVQNTRQVATGSGLTGGGDLTADRTLAVDFTAVATAAQGAAADSAVQPGDLATVATTGAYADLSGAPASSRWALRLPTNLDFVAVPNPVIYTGLTELDVRVVVRVDDWADPATVRTLANHLAGGQWALRFAQIRTTGNPIRVTLSSDGATLVDANWSSPTLPTGVAGLRFVWRADNGSGTPDVRIFSSADEGATWTLEYTDDTGIPASLHESTFANWQWGSDLGGELLTGTVIADGTTVAEYDATAGVVQRYTDEYDNVWTLNGSAWSGRKGL